MCQQCGSKFFQYEWNKPEDPEDLPFTPEEFRNACVLVRDGPFDDDNENWTRLVRMYKRIVTLRIDVVQYCEDVLSEKLFGSPVYMQFIAADQAHRTRAPFPFGLPFSAQDFLTICREMTQSYVAYHVDNVEIHLGSGLLFFNMVKDLVRHRINLVDFLADHVPANTEKDFHLTRLLAAAQGPHTQNYEVHWMRFSILCLKNRPRGIVIDPLSHFQAAMFIQTLEEVDASLVPDHHKQMVARPHSDCIEVSDGKFVLSPCCSQKTSVCCMMRRLMLDGPRCPVCARHQLEVRKYQLREQE